MESSRVLKTHVVFQHTTEVLQWSLSPDSMSQGIVNHPLSFFALPHWRYATRHRTIQQLSPFLPFPPCLPSRPLVVGGYRLGGSWLGNNPRVRPSRAPPRSRSSRGSLNLTNTLTPSGPTNCQWVWLNRPCMLKSESIRSTKAKIAPLWCTQVDECFVVSDSHLEWLAASTWYRSGRPIE